MSIDRDMVVHGGIGSSPTRTTTQRLYRLRCLIMLYLMVSCFITFFFSCAYADLLLIHVRDQSKGRRIQQSAQREENGTKAY